MTALVVTAPAELREMLDGLTTGVIAKRCRSFHLSRARDSKTATKYTLRSLARHYQQLSEEVRELESEIRRPTRMVAPTPVDAPGVGLDTAATLLIGADSNAGRFHSEAAFASLCGVNPIPASSGSTNRHPLNRDGDGQANAALYRMVIVRLRFNPRTQAYMVEEPLRA